MNEAWVQFLLLTILCLVLQGFFSMLEMACVSFNKVRLQYYVAHHNRRANWISYLLNHPTRLFGTTLIGVNTAMQFGSECARRFYFSLGLSPDWAPLTQVVVVLIFAELAPMFAARKYAEHVTMIGIPVIYLTSKILKPVIFLLNWICRFFNYLLGITSKSVVSLSREELQKAIEEREEGPSGLEGDAIDPILMNIFSLTGKKVKELMQPLEETPMVSSTTTISGMRKMMESQYLPFLPVYQQQKKNVVGVAFPRDLLRYSSTAEVQSYMRPAWFITEDSPVFDILKQFKRNSQSMAVVLNRVGFAVGTLTLDSVIDEIFGQKDHWISIGDLDQKRHHVVVERTFSGSVTLQEVQELLNIALSDNLEMTLEQLMAEKLQRAPELGESIMIGDWILEIEESSLISGKSIRIKTRF